MPKSIWEKFAQSPFQQENSPTKLSHVVTEQERVVQVQNRVNLQELTPRSPVFSAQTAYQILNPPIGAPDPMDPQTISGLVSYWVPANIASPPYQTAATAGSNLTWLLGNAGGGSSVPTYAAGPPKKWSFSGSKCVFTYDQATSLLGYPFNGDHTMGFVLRNVTIVNATRSGLIWFNGANTNPSIMLMRDTDNLYKLGIGTAFTISSTVTLSPQPTGTDITVIITRDSMTNAMDFYVNSLSISATSTYDGVLGANPISAIIPYTPAPPTSMDMNELFFIGRKITAREVAGINNYWQKVYGVGIAS